MIDPKAVLRILRQHQGRDRAITAPGIASRLGRGFGTAREVRRVIAANRDAWEAELGLALCTAPGGGYWFSDDYEQVEALVAFFDGLAARASRKADAARASMARIGFTGLAVKRAIQEGAAASRARNAEKAASAAPELLEWVKGHMRREGLTAAALARQIGISKGTMSQLLSGTYRGKAPARFVKGALALRKERL